MQGSRYRKSTDVFREGILDGNRIVLGQAITLIESALEDDQQRARELLDSLTAHMGNSLRIGITGPPGVGKSTFIEAFGKYLTAQSIPIAVLTIDPTSNRSHGSILGDKTRMQSLATDPLAFIRPTAAGSILGGVAQKTREAMSLCEAAGYKVIIIETVGVGQSEIAIKNMIDFFLLLALPGAGDELQGIKKGIMEAADMVLVTKADGDNIGKATQAQSEINHALHLATIQESNWTPRVHCVSAVEGKGLPEIWSTIQAFEQATKSSGWFDENRKQQRIKWMKEYFQQLLESDIAAADLDETQTKNENDVKENKISPYAAARNLLAQYHDAIRGSKS
jgi:LAO/AO transport system kinase